MKRCEGGDNCIMRISCTLHFSPNIIRMKVEDDEMGGACSMTDGEDVRV
jgi:hypothetical protein